MGFKRRMILAPSTISSRINCLNPKIQQINITDIGGIDDILQYTEHCVPNLAIQQWSDAKYDFCRGIRRPKSLYKDQICRLKLVQNICPARDIVGAQIHENNIRLVKRCVPIVLDRSDGPSSTRSA